MTQSWQSQYEIRQYERIRKLLRATFVGHQIASSPYFLDSRLVTRLLTDQPNRIAHSLSAFRLARELAPLLKHDIHFANELTLCALMHDIGYAKKLQLTGSHSVDGAAFLAYEKVSPRIVSTILFHTATADLAKTIYPSDSVINLFYACIQNYIPTTFDHAIAAIDLHTSPTGERVSIRERLEEISIRHKGPIANFMNAHCDDFYQSRNLLIKIGGKQVKELLPESSS